MVLNSEQFDALILDMDGVFVDSEPLWFEAFRQVFTPMGIEFTDEYLYSGVGVTTRQNLLDISREFKVDLDIDQYEKIIEESFKSVLERKAHGANKGIWPLIDQAREAGMAVGLCTSTAREAMMPLIQRVIEHDNKDKTVDNIFDAIVTFDDVRNRKPHPEPYNKITAVLNIAQSRSVAIEDSKSGIESATSAGCYCIGLKTLYNHEKNLTGADHIINSLLEIKIK